MDNFLPKNYEAPVTGGNNYYKLKEGANKFRVLSNAIVGWLDWEQQGDKKVPIRTKHQPDSKTARHFWAFVIYDYADGEIKIMEITQASIREDMMNYIKSEDWGSPLNYDITINRTGKELDTKYSLTVSPIKPISEDIKYAHMKKQVDLQQLFVNGDPFKGGTHDDEEEDFETPTDRETQFNGQPTAGEEINVENIPL